MKKILVIEDNHEVRDNIAEILELANYLVFRAENGKEGIVIAMQEFPDLILCDIMMPVLDGYGFLHLMKKNDSLCNTPFIFMSAKADRIDVRKGMDLGADDYLTKPFDETELLNAIETRLKKAEMVNQKSQAAVDKNDFKNPLSENEIRELLTGNRDTGIYKKKQLIYSEGSRPLRMYYIQKGKVKTYRTNADGKQLITGLYKEGDFLGYIPIMEGTSYKDMAEAIEFTELAVIPKEDFMELISTSREAVNIFTHLLTHHISQKEEMLVGMAYNSLRRKVAEALIGVHEIYKTTIDMSRQNLAALAGTATESMIRTLNDFKSEKIIDINDGIITILNEKKLMNMVN
ncbi:response regulator [Niastella populi]|uniref:Transcriptional regulator n=1 Tax=Niastella populi TaxID=550983 RepID=A0A1V9ESB0_9BACT|nr:response regulator [Niastella populi]OQP48932.1 transcriptional regulator [Niastella populi]